MKVVNLTLFICNLLFFYLDSEFYGKLIIEESVIDSYVIEMNTDEQKIHSFSLKRKK